MVKRTIKSSDIDIDKNGQVSADEIEAADKTQEIELREEKADSQQRMAWASLISIIVFTFFLFTPMVTESRVSALADLLGMFYISMASIVGFHFGSTAWLTKNK